MIWYSYGRYLPFELKNRISCDTVPWHHDIVIIKKHVALGKPKRIVYKNMDGKIKELSSSDLMEGIWYTELCKYYE